MIRTTAPLLRSAALRTSCTAVAPAHFIALRQSNHQFLFHRHCSSKPKEEEKEEPAPAVTFPAVVFDGPKARALKIIKLCSVINLGLSFVACPIIMSAAPDGKGGTFMAMAMTLTFFGATTTGALHWAGKPYLCQLRATSEEDIEVDSITLLGGIMTTKSKFVDIKPPVNWHPFSSMEIAGKSFYLDPMGIVGNEALMQKLLAAAGKGNDARYQNMDTEP